MTIDLRAHDYITTFTGARFTYANPGPFRIRDIAHSLALSCRFRGHTVGFYSVAEHSLLVSWLCEQDGKGFAVQLAALLHDAHEAYTGDVPSPLKWDCPEFKEIEDRVERCLRGALTPYLPPSFYAATKPYDIQALHIEAAQLFTTAPAWARPIRNDLALGLPSCQEAERLFLERAAELGLDIG